MEEFLKRKELPKWLTETLDPICDVDTDSLTEYIIALISNQFSSRRELEDICFKDLEDFLKENTKSFTYKLTDKLSAINYFNYNPSSSSSKDENDSHHRDHHRDESHHREHHHRDHDSSHHRDRERERDFRSRSRSRSRSRDRRPRDRSSSRDRDRDGRGYRERDLDNGSRSSYRERERDGSDSADTSSDDRRKYSEDYERKRNKTQRYNPMAGRGGSSSSSSSTGAPPSNNGGPKYKTKRCRNFDENGYCERGSSCHFIHSNLPDATTPIPPYPNHDGSMYNQPPRYNLPPNIPPGTTIAQPTMMAPLPYPFHNIHPQAAANMYPSPMMPQHPIDSVQGYNPDYYDVDVSMNNNNDDQGGNDDDENTTNKRGGGGQFKKFIKVKTSHSCPDPNSTTLIITNIPPNINTEEEVKSHFSKFGNIENIEKISISQCLVKFESNGDAVKAMKSPEAIMNNRFIKLFWYDNYDGKKTKFEEIQEKLELQKKKEEEKQALQLKEQILQKKLEEKRKEAKKDFIKSRDELRQHQLDLQKQYIDKLEKCTDEGERQTIKDIIKNLEKEITESITKDTSMVKEITAKKQPAIAPFQQQHQSNIPTTDSSSSMSVDNTTLETTPPSTSTPTTPLLTTQSKSNLENILKNLENEAKSLGIEIPLAAGGPTTTKPPMIKSKPPAPFTPKKPYPKALPTPPVSSNKHKNSSVIIDNRSTTIVIRDPPNEFKKEDLLKKLFSDVQTVTVNPTDSSVEIKFTKRESAERVFLVAKSYKGKELQISWVEKPPATTTIQPTKRDQDIKMKSNNGNDSDHDEDDDEEDDDNERSWKH